MSIQRSHARPSPAPALENTAIAGDGQVDGGHPVPTRRDCATPPGATQYAPTADRGKFDLLFACGVSAAFWGVVIFLLTVLL